MSSVAKIFIVSLLFSLSACSPKVISFINDDLDLRDYETYRMIKVDKEKMDFSTDGMALFLEIEEAIASQMDRRLYVETQKPDLIVKYDIINSQRTVRTNPNTGVANYWYYSPRTSTINRYTDGVLLIELRDLDQNKLLWQGSMELNDLRDKNVISKIKQAVHQIFLTYPHIAGSAEVVDFE